MIKRSLTLASFALLALVLPVTAQDVEQSRPEPESQATAEIEPSSTTEVDPQESAESGQPSTDMLYVEFRQAVCRQDWSEAIDLMDQLLDQDLGDLRQQYVAYRRQLVDYRQSEAEFDEMPGCDGESYVSVEG